MHSSFWIFVGEARCLWFFFIDINRQKFVVIDSHFVEEFMFLLQWNRLELRCWPIVEYSSPVKIEKSFNMFPIDNEMFSSYLMSQLSCKSACIALVTQKFRELFRPKYDSNHLANFTIRLCGLMETVDVSSFGFVSVVKLKMVYV